jgi:hypothetical protein
MALRCGSCEPLHSANSGNGIYEGVEDEPDDPLVELNPPEPFEDDESGPMAVANSPIDAIVPFLVQ